MTNFRQLVHSPAELAQEHVAWAKHLKDTPGVPFGLPSIDDKVIPFHPGDMVTFVARPGHGKTSILAWLARTEAKRIIARGAKHTEAVVYVTWEQVTEEINAVLDIGGSYTVSDIAWGRADLDAVEAQARKRAGLPIWLIGDSLARTDSSSPRMYPDAVFAAIETMHEEHGVKPSLLCFDYIQLIPIPSQADRMKQVTEAAHRCKELAKRVGCPAAVAVQARREVDSRDLKIPGLWDAQWASSIEQTADKYFSLWRPWLTEPRDSVIDIDGRPIPVTENVLILSMQKQRFESGRWTWALWFDPATLELQELDTHTVPLNKPDLPNF